MRFVLNGSELVLTADQVLDKVRGVPPEGVRRYGVRLDGVVFPVQQAFELATGVPRGDFTGSTAREHLQSLGFEVTETSRRPGDGRPRRTPPGHSDQLVDPDGWPWEGQVQAQFAAHLHAAGWQVTSMADTATKDRGVDVLAQKGDRAIGAEVKGWPSKDYAEPRRAGKVPIARPSTQPSTQAGHPSTQASTQPSTQAGRPSTQASTQPSTQAGHPSTQPGTQAGHWFSQALLKAMMLRDSHPDHESLIVLPDSSRYRELAERTSTGRAACALHVVFITREGTTHSDTWSA